MQKILNHLSLLLHGLRLFYCSLIILFFWVNSIYSQNNNEDSEYKIHTVVIDPGHGGKDSGARGKTAFEKDIVLAIGLKLGKYIEENMPDIKVIYTRKTDEFIPLYRRAEIANENNADLFISIHANGWSDPNSSGTETLVLGLHRADENFEVAKRENSVILLEEDYTTRYENFDPNSLESYIIFSLMQNVYDKQSINFAGLVQDQFRERAKRKDRGVKRQGLLVLAQSSMPGVLVETGFISNTEEEKYLTSDSGQDYIASAIFRAFKDYKTDIEAKSSTALMTKPDTASSDTKTLNEKDTEHNNPIVNDHNISFKVQVAASSLAVPLNSTEFAEFGNVEEYKTDSIYKYAVGSKSSYSEIVEYSKLVKNRFPDAFIIAVKDGKIIPIQEALNEIYKN
jgi:N-acetylmuramoyl-L-alanine amidase